MTGGAWLRLEWEVARSFGLAMFVGGAGAVGFLAFAHGLPLEFAALAAVEAGGAGFWVLGAGCWGVPSLWVSSVVGERLEEEVSFPAGRDRGQV